MNELIKVENREGIATCNARELHEYMEVGKDFSNWIKDRIEKYGFIEGIDFTPELAESNGGRPSKEYYITLDMAKELSMVENNEKGKEARKYFIAIEKKAKELATIPTGQALISMALIEAHKYLEAKDKIIEELKPKAEFYDQVTDSKDAIDIGESAKVLNMGIGRNNLFELLRHYKILMSNNQPYQKYIDAGLFRTIETQYTDSYGDIHINIKTVVFQRGLDYIRKVIEKYQSNKSMKEKELFV